MGVRDSALSRPPLSARTGTGPWSRSRCPYRSPAPVPAMGARQRVEGAAQRVQVLSTVPILSSASYDALRLERIEGL